MPSSERLDKVFAEVLVNRPFGHAVYKHVSAQKMRPGACGYFDRNGDWSTIVHLSDLQNQTASENSTTVPSPAPEGQTQNQVKLVPKWTTPAAVEYESNNVGLWKPQTADRMRKFYVRADTGVEVPTLPVGVGGSAGFRSEDGRGAVLLTGGDITHNRIVHDDHLSEWFDLNAATIARDYKTTQRKGVWIITSTYTATKRAERVLLDKQSEATFSIDVTLHDAGKLAASTGFWSGSRDESWTAHEDPDGTVLFASGLYWRPRFFSSKFKSVENRHKHKWLSTDNKPSPIYVAVDGEEDPEDDVVRFFPQRAVDQGGFPEPEESQLEADYDEEGEGEDDGYADNDDEEE